MQENIYKIKRNNALPLPPKKWVLFSLKSLLRPFLVGRRDTASLTVLGLCFVILLPVCIGFACFWILYKRNHTMFILWLAFSLNIMFLRFIQMNVCSCRVFLFLAVDRFLFPFPPAGHFIYLCVWSPKVCSWSCSSVWILESACQVPPVKSPLRLWKEPIESIDQFGENKYLHEIEFSSSCTWCVSLFNVFSKVIYIFLIKIMPFLLDLLLTIWYCYGLWK